MSLGVHVSLNHLPSLFTIVMCVGLSICFHFLRKQFGFCVPLHSMWPGSEQPPSSIARDPASSSAGQSADMWQDFFFVLERTTGINYSIRVVDYVFSSAPYTPLINAI